MIPGDGQNISTGWGRRRKFGDPWERRDLVSTDLATRYPITAAAGSLSVYYLPLEPWGHLSRNNSKFPKKHEQGTR